MNNTVSWYDFVALAITFVFCGTIHFHCVFAKLWRWSGAIVRLAKEQRGSAIWRTPLKNPSETTAGGSRRLHLKIWRYYRWSCNCCNTNFHTVAISRFPIFSLNILVVFGSILLTFSNRIFFYFGPDGQISSWQV